MNHLAAGFIAAQIALSALAFVAADALAQDETPVDASGEPVIELEPAPPPPPPGTLEPPAVFDAGEWSEAQIDELAIALFDAHTHGLPDLQEAAFDLLHGDHAGHDRDQLARYAFLRLAAWQRFGLVDQETLQARLLSNEEWGGLEADLAHALTADTVAETLAGFAPPVRDYDVLRAEMMRYAAFTPFWPAIDDGPALTLGDAGERVDQLRARLAAEDLLPDDWTVGAAYDVRLETAVRRFQGRVNLSPTGRMDRSTLRALNITPEQRIQQLRANLEQRRWRSRELGRRHIWINIADFHLEAWEDGQLAREHEVMVGRQASSTPEFSEEMQYLVLNPWWGLPNGSARPRWRSIRRNPGVVRDYGFRIFNGSGEAISVYEIDWSRWGNGWPYRLSQPPGPRNPMGEIKFIFPNRHNVYMHDTIERDRFVRTRRDFSAGCIRVQDPLALAEWALQGQDDWDLERLEAVAGGNTPRVIWLDDRIPVHISYWTVVGDADGKVRYLNDLYNRDRRLISAVDSLASTPFGTVNLSASASGGGLTALQ